MRFGWDPKKAESNRRKDGVSFEEAAAAFADPLALVVDDALHAERMILVGRSDGEPYLPTSSSSRSSIRIISARRATAHERRRYEEGNP